VVDEVLDVTDESLDRIVGRPRRFTVPPQIATMAQRIAGGRARGVAGLAGSKTLAMPSASNRSAIRRSVRSGTLISLARAAGGDPNRTTGRINS
jgi:hypothetical protein